MASGAGKPPSNQRQGRGPGQRRRWLGLLAGLLVVTAGLAAVLVAVLAIETSPAVPLSSALEAGQVSEGRKAFTRVRKAVIGGDGSQVIMLNASELASIAALAGRGLGQRRSAAGVDGAVAMAAVSVDLPAGLWLNLSVRAAASTAGFPPLELRAGDLVISGWPARALAGAARQWLVWRGLPLQPLDAMVRSLTVENGGLRLQPGRGFGQTGLVSAVIGLGSGQIDQARVSAIYCVLAQQQRALPSDDLAVHLHRMIAATPATTARQAAADHRDGLVALALVVAGKSALGLTDRASSPLAACPMPALAVRLAGRPDLAKHWAVSAALAAVGGLRTGQLLGEWKELADSMTGGSGFSFADLAADRAGLMVGVAAVDPARALAVRSDLRGRRNDGLLPPSVLGLAEGLSEQRFVAQYRDTESDRFAAAVREIDALLARGKAPGAALLAAQ